MRLPGLIFSPIFPRWMDGLIHYDYAFWGCGNHRHRRVSVSAKFSSSLVVIFHQSLILHPILIFCTAYIYLGPRNAEWLVNLSFARHWLRASFNTASHPHGKIKINWIEHFSAKVFWINVAKTNPQGCFLTFAFFSCYS